MKKVEITPRTRMSDTALPGTIRLHLQGVYCGIELPAGPVALSAQDLDGLIAMLMEARDKCAFEEARSGIDAAIGVDETNRRRRDN